MRAPSAASLFLSTTARTGARCKSTCRITPVHDLVIKNDDLVVATHGRAFWILDDVSPLRQFADSVAAEDMHLYKPATAYRMHSGDAPAALSFAGKNPPNGAVIYFYLKKAPKTGNEAGSED